MFKNLLLSAIFTALTLPVAFLPEASAASPVNVPGTIAKPVNDSIEFDAEFLKAKIISDLGFNVHKVEKTPLPGVAMFVADQGIFYISNNGDFLIQGKIFSLGDTVTNLTEDSLADVRLTGLNTFKDDVITYKAKDEKFVVTVFTDITCGYCRKMHAQVEEYNNRGITINYLAYPRAGLTDRTGQLSQGFKDLRSIWCSDDTAAALTRAKTASSGQPVPLRICEAPIKEQFNFGRQIGVSGTPAIILPDGSMIPGYQPPAQLEQILKNS